MEGRAKLASGGSRLGLMVDQPSSAMADQLNLPQNTGLVIVEVAEQAGERLHDSASNLIGLGMRVAAGDSPFM